MKEEVSAIKAKEIAQQWAFAPVFFQVIMTMRRKGLFEHLIQSRKKGSTVLELVKASGLSEYAIEVLIEAALTAGFVEEQNKHYFVTKVGYFLAKDPMTDANIDFVNDVCYQGMFHLDESLEEGKPAGLKELGNWPTVYEGLSQLKDPAKESWFKFDHYYSDGSFNDALKFVANQGHKHILDIGGNTGKFAKAYTALNENNRLTIVDLPGQIEMAKKSISPTKMAEQVSYFPTNILDKEGSLPTHADAVWMSQFLDCFSKDEIVFILKKVKQYAPSATVYIMETFWDNQRYDAAKYCLTGTSLYFTTIANGNSKMYHSEAFLEAVNEAGYSVTETHDLTVHSFHTILKCVAN